MNNKAVYNIGYGLYIISAKCGEKDNACVSNTVIQVTSSPDRIAVTLNNANRTTEMIKESGKFNVSILSQSAPFEIFKRFGFQSGRDADKFSGCEYSRRTGNGLLCIAKHSNAYISADVISSVDLGSHTMFVADIVDCDVLSEEPTVTYAFYHSNIKPKPKAEKKSGYRCKICGFFHEGELPEGFTCPVCGHGVSDFEKVDAAQNATASEKDLKGTKTEANLQSAFAGESQARNKYTFFAQAARAEGYEYIASIFEETAANEKAHANMWFNLLHGGSVPSTAENLKAAAAGENYEWTDMYAQFAREAREEGFDKIARLFELVGDIENRHEKRYLDMLDKVKKEKVFAGAESAKWECINCGFVHEGGDSPDRCPVCGYGKAFFKPHLGA